MRWPAPTAVPNPVPVPSNERLLRLQTVAEDDPSERVGQFFYACPRLTGMRWAKLFERAERWTVTESELTEALAERRADRTDE